jgi:dihydroorotase
MVRKAKRAGLQVTCSTTAAHLMFCDEDLSGFEGTLRVTSPFRSADDRDALREGVLDGTIDAVVSDHRPEDLEHHDVEFMLSPEGIATLPSAFSMALSGLKASATSPQAALEALIKALTDGPRHILSLPQATLESGQPCNLTWFHPAEPHRPQEGSKGVNVPPIKEGQIGQVLGVFKADRHWTA